MNPEIEVEINSVADIEIEEIDKIGPRGYSAYEVAVQNGYVGTEEQWLESLKVKGDKGDKPIKGIDYFTEEDKDELKQDITSDIVDDATSDFNRNVAGQTTLFNTHVENKKTEINQYVNEKTTAFNTNATNKTDNFNSNASSKLNEYNSNHTTKLSEYNQNATDKVSDYNTNATEKTNAYDTNASNKLTAYNDNASEKLNAYNTNHTEKLQAYNDNATNKTNDFNNNAESYSKRLDRAEMVYNALPKVEGEGTNLTLDDTAEAPMKMSLGANTEQASTTGKNKLPIIDGTSTFNGITCKIENGKITLSGTSTVNYIWVKLTNGIEFMNGTPSSTNKPTWFANNSFGNGTFSFSKIGTTKAFNYTKTNATSSDVLFTASQTTKTIDLTNETFSDVLYYVGASGTTINETFYLQAVNGSTPDTDFEPYTGGTASPNPDYPQDIHTISGDNEIKVIGKNWFDKNMPRTYNGNASKTIVNENIVITDIASSSGNHYAHFTFLDLTGLEGKTIRVTCNFINSSSNKGRFMIRCASSSTGVGEAINSGSSGNLLTYVVPQGLTDGRYLGISLYSNYSGTWSSGCYVTYKDLIVTVDDADMTYREHQEQSLPLNLGDLEYSKIGDYEDEFVIPSDKNLFDESYYNDATLYTQQTPYFASLKLPDSFKTKFYGNMNLKGTSQSLVFGFSNSYNTVSTRMLNGGTITNNVEYDFTNATDVYLVIGNSNNINVSIDIPKIFNNYNIMISKTSGEPYEPYNDGKWYLKKNIGKVVLDGSENWTNFFSTNGIYINSVIIQSLNNASSINCLSNYYISTTRAYIRNNLTSADNVCATNGGELIIANKSITSIADFKTWLSTHNTEVDYVLETPQYILLNDTLQSQLDEIYKWVKSYQDQTNISQVNNDLPFVIKASAVYDLNKLLTRVETLEAEV